MPDKRPSIPAEVCRALLVESGHRCAVCGDACPLERAHIIPWHKSASHAIENLICLCASCHQRADLEKWGEKTLRAYKERPWILRKNDEPVLNAGLSTLNIARLTIDKKNVSIETRAAKAGIPRSPLEFRIHLDAINHGQQTATLISVDVVAFEMRSSLLAAEPASSVLYTDLGRRVVRLPIAVGVGQRNPSLLHVIQVNFREGDRERFAKPKGFAQQLRDLGSYRIDLRYIYEDMERAEHHETLQIEGSFDSYRQRLIESWKRDRLHELVKEASGI